MPKIKVCVLHPDRQTQVGTVLAVFESWWIKVGLSVTCKLELVFQIIDNDDLPSLMRGNLLL